MLIFVVPAVVLPPPTSAGAAPVDQQFEALQRARSHRAEVRAPDEQGTVIRAARQAGDVQFDDAAGARGRAGDLIGAGPEGHCADRLRTQSGDVALDAQTVDGIAEIRELAVVQETGVAQGHGRSIGHPVAADRGGVVVQREGAAGDGRSWWPGRSCPLRCRKGSGWHHCTRRRHGEGIARGIQRLAADTRNREAAAAGDRTL